MSGEITQAELDSLRQAQDDFMPQRVVLKRREFFGDNESEYFAFAEDVPARIVPGFSFWRDMADRFQGVTAFTVTMPWDTEVRAADIIVDETNRVFEIRDVRSPASYLTAKQCLCDMVTD